MPGPTFIFLCFGITDVYLASSPVPCACCRLLAVGAAVVGPIEAPQKKPSTSVVIPLPSTITPVDWGFVYLRISTKMRGVPDIIPAHTPFGRWLW